MRTPPSFLVLRPPAALSLPDPGPGQTRRLAPSEPSRRLLAFCRQEDGHARREATLFAALVLVGVGLPLGLCAWPDGRGPWQAGLREFAVRALQPAAQTAADAARACCLPTPRRVLSTFADEGR